MLNQLASLDAAKNKVEILPSELLEKEKNDRVENHLWSIQFEFNLHKL